jgi:hypothetical protein
MCDLWRKSPYSLRDFLPQLGQHVRKCDDGNVLDLGYGAGKQDLKTPPKGWTVPFHDDKHLHKGH